MAKDNPAMTAPRQTQDAPLLGKGMLLVLFAAVVMLRIPNVLLQGRFFGEEGSYFFAYAWHMEWWEALFHPLGGYINVIASGGTLLARQLVGWGLIPLESAPWVTTLIALAFQMLPAVLIVNARDAWLAPRLAKPAALALIAAAPMAHEVWLHSLHSQFHLTLCVALALACKVPESRRGRALYLAILALSPLCGPAAIVFLPFFGLKALIERTRGRWAQVFALGIGAAVQMLVFYYPVMVRGHSFDPAMLSALLLVRQAILPLAGPFAAKDAGFAIFQQLPSGGVGVITVLASGLVFGTLIFFALRQWRQPAAWLVIPGLLLACVSYFGAIATPAAMLLPLVGERYSFVPNVLIGLSLIAMASTTRGIGSRIFGALVAVEVVVAVAFFSGPKAEMTEGPRWADEVAKWRADPAYRLEGWPSGWAINLAPGAPRCPKVAGPADPEYCDGHWEEREKRSIAGMAQ